MAQPLGPHTLESRTVRASRKGPVACRPVVARYRFRGKGSARGVRCRLRSPDSTVLGTFTEATGTSVGRRSGGPTKGSEEAELHGCRAVDVAERRIPHGAGRLAGTVPPPGGGHRPARRRGGRAAPRRDRPQGAERRAALGDQPATELPA